MVRLLVHVEGETEEEFVKELLRPHLLRCGFDRVEARLLGNQRQRSSRGGVRAWTSARNDLLRHLKEDGESIATTMVDYYAMPSSGVRAWPGRADSAKSRRPDRKASVVEAALAKDIIAQMGRRFDPRRFIAFVVMHEFEGLLFSDCDRFARGIYRPSLAGTLQAVRDEFSTPEEINDSPLTAPSKRVGQIVAGYQKPFHGNLAALEIGLERIRAECPHFDAWLRKLERLTREG